jgi:hypothetical protein
VRKRNQLDDEWFEIADTDWLDPSFKPKKLKLLADAQIPRLVIQEITAAIIRVDSLDTSERRAPDSDVLRHASKNGCVLLTLGGDFWDDRKYPLQSLQRGVIYIAESPPTW